MFENSAQQYNNTAGGALAGSPVRSQALNRTQTVLAEQLDQIEKQLHALASVGEQIGGATNRLLNPRPVDASMAGADVPASPPAGSVEGRLQNISRALSYIHSRFAAVASTLDSAI